MPEVRNLDKSIGAEQPQPRLKFQQNTFDA